MDAALPTLITRHQRRISVISWAALVVSFVHQATSLLLFSGDAPWDMLAALAQTAIVDLAIWAIGEYIYELRRGGRSVGWLIWLLFLIALIVSIGLNFSYLYTHRPTASVLDETFSLAIAIVFAIFVPFFIGASGLMRGQLEAWRADLAEQIKAEQATEQELREARAAAAQLEHERNTIRAELEQERAATAQRSAETARLVGNAAQERDANALQLQTTAQERDTLRAQLRTIEQQAAQQLEQVRAEARSAVQHAAQEAETLRGQLAELMEQAELPQLARALEREGLAARAIARAFGKSDSTVRGWLQKAQSA